MSTRSLPSLLALATGLLTLVGASSARADLLLEGATIALATGTTSAAEPALAGAVIEDRSDAFTMLTDLGPITGTIQSRVVRAVDGTVDFYWRVFSDINSADLIGAFRLGNEVTADYRVNWRSDGLGEVSPLSAHRFSGALSSAFNFNLGHIDTSGAPKGLGAGQSTYFMFLDTDAVDYAMTGLMDVANVPQTRLSNLLATFAPAYKASEVPEPGSLALVALAFAIGLVPRRRPTA